LLGTGKGTFTAQQIPTGNGSISVSVADLNGDGLLDLAIANRLDQTINILLGQENYSAAITGLKLPGTGSQTVSATLAADKNFAASTSNALTLSTTP
jgi:hypothetical protein